MGKIFRFGKKDVSWVGLLTQPGDEPKDICLRHHGTARGVKIGSALDMEKDCAACSGDRRSGIMTDLHEPPVGRIVQAHPLFLEPGRRVSGVDRHVLVVIWQRWIIDPCVVCADCVKRVICPGRKGAVVGVDLSDLKNAGRGTAVVFLFCWSYRIFWDCMFSSPPRKAVFTLEHAPWWCDRAPSVAVPLEKLHATGR